MARFTSSLILASVTTLALFAITTATAHDDQLSFTSVGKNVLQANEGVLKDVEQQLAKAVMNAVSNVTKLSPDQMKTIANNHGQHISMDTVGQIAQSGSFHQLIEELSHPKEEYAQLRTAVESSITSTMKKIMPNVEDKLFSTTTESIAKSLNNDVNAKNVLSGHNPIHEAFCKSCKTVMPMIVKMAGSGRSGCKTVDGLTSSVCSAALSKISDAKEKGGVAGMVASHLTTPCRQLVGRSCEAFSTFHSVLSRDANPCSMATCA